MLQKSIIQINKNNKKNKKCVLELGTPIHY